MLHGFGTVHTTHNCHIDIEYPSIAYLRRPHNMTFISFILASCHPQNGTSQLSTPSQSLLKNQQIILDTTQAQVSPQMIIPKLNVRAETQTQGKIFHTAKVYHTHTALENVCRLKNMRRMSSHQLPSRLPTPWLAADNFPMCKRAKKNSQCVINILVVSRICLSLRTCRFRLAANSAVVVAQRRLRYYPVSRLQYVGVQFAADACTGSTAAAEAGARPTPVAATE